MTDSMNFGPDWIRNLSSEGSTGGGGSGGGRYQLAEYRYGREEMLALFDRNSKPPAFLTNFKCLYSEASLQPLALQQTSEEERGWSGRPAPQPSGPPRGRGGSLDRGGRIGRGRGGYQYGRPGYEVGGGWGGNNGDQQEWSPRKEYGNQRTASTDNWRRSRNNEEDDGWRNISQGRGGVHDKWGRSSSWRGEGDSEERTGPPERGGRSHWGESRPPPSRKTWDNEDHLPEWATENPAEGGGTFDEKGAFHGSDDEPESKHPGRRETGLQKSTSQQHIVTKRQPPPLSSSKSTTSLVRPEDSFKKREDPASEEEEDVHTSSDRGTTEERKVSVPNIPEKIDKNVLVQERAKSEGPPSQNKKSTNGPIDEKPRNEDSEFEKLQEDFVLKLVVDEELPKPTVNNLEMGSIQPPPNLAAPQIHDKWFYQDPQGQMQGPFSNMEMAEWFKAGYFSNQLKVRRHCDERFFLLGELITICGGANPFQSGVRFPVLKNDVTKMPADPDILQFQYLSQMAAYKQAQARVLAEPWSAITLQQQELAAQRLIMQQQQVSQDLQYLQHSQATNPLMHMINQMQQANKLPGPGLVDKPPQTLPGALDPHMQMHMSNILSLQNRIPTPGMANSLPAGLTNHSVLPPPETLPGLQPAAPLGAGALPMSGMQSNIPVSIGGSINIPRHGPHGSVDQISSGQASDPISSLLKQLQQQSQHSQQVESLWQQNSFPSNTPPQWQPQNEIPMSMWDIPQTEKIPKIPSPTETVQPIPPQPKLPKIEKEKEKEQTLKDEASAKEMKKKKEQEEKQAKKEAEEKRKQEQKKLEAEKKAADERRRKEEERIKRELEKAKREAEEKRMRELEEKRRLKEQRKAEEDARKKMEENKKLEEERLREEMKEQEKRRQEEEKRLQAEERRLHAEQIRLAKAAPWSQANSTLGMSLAEIQKAEREKRAVDAALQMQRLQEEKEYQQIHQEKTTAGMPLSWAKKPVEPRKVKSLAEIQAEEQERLAKQAAESRLQKEKEPAPVTNNTSSIWSSQNLTWANPSTNSQWSSSSGGFWDDSSNRQAANKPSTVSKSSSTNTLSTVSKQQQQSQTQKQQAKSNKAKKEEAKANHNNNNNNGPPIDDFTSWCYNTLSHISTNIDIPTFVTFLRDIESAFDVREYCKEYLGESNATHQFASNFLEKRRSFKPKNNAHKDDMCSPAPAITPSLQHSTEFQEVKGKNRKIKKSKMLKVDSRILGFNVTSAPDRINVGDRDYGDNS